MASVPSTASIAIIYPSAQTTLCALSNSDKASRSSLDFFISIISSFLYFFKTSELLKLKSLQYLNGDTALKLCSLNISTTASKTAPSPFL